MLWHETWESLFGPPRAAERTRARISKPTRIIGAAIGIGAIDTRCERGPDYLAARGLADKLRQHSPSLSWEQTVRLSQASPNDPALAQIASFCENLAQTIRGVVTAGRRAWVLGGDHSCAIGTWNGVSQALDGHGQLGLIWIDAHMDCHTPETSPSGAVHGMPLACLLGLGSESLVAIGGAPKLTPENVCIIGVRRFEPAEAALLERLGVRIYFMDEVRQRGLETIMYEAVDLLDARTAGFGITIDLDAVDPSDAPGVGSPEIGGIRGENLAQSLCSVANHPALLGVEIAEFNPDKDVNDRTADLVYKLLASVAGMRGSHEYDD